MCSKIGFLGSKTGCNSKLILEEAVQRKITKFLCFKRGQYDCNYIKRLKI